VANVTLEETDEEHEYKTSKKKQKLSALKLHSASETAIAATSYFFPRVDRQSKLGHESKLVDVRIQ